MRQSISMKRAGFLAAVGAAIRIGARAFADARRVDPSLAALLERIRAEHRLPALAGAIVTLDGAIDQEAVGVRKAGTTIPVTANDLWHLGSDTKAMTALLAGTFVAEKRLAWDDRVSSFFPQIAAGIPTARRDITVADLLSHRAGLAENFPRDRAAALEGPIIGQRRAVAEWLLQAPAYPPGAFHYSNGGYIVMGAILEKLGEKVGGLMRERIFVPLHMDSAGFGGQERSARSTSPGRIGRTERPLRRMVPRWTTCPTWGRPVPSIARWRTGRNFSPTRCVAVQENRRFCPRQIYTAMQTPASGSTYGFGWIIVPRHGLVE